MRSLVLHEIGELRVEDRETPTPGDGEVLIRVTATGICGSDIHGYSGENGRRFPGQVMGHESVGRLASFGPGDGSTGLAVGQVVTFNPVVVPVTDATKYAGREQHSPNKTVIGVAPEVPAAFAEFVVVPARNVVALPDSMPIEYGALVEPLAVAVHAVRRVHSASDTRALVIGGGPKQPLRMGSDTTRFTFGHGGAGTSICWGDTELGVSMVYLPNGYHGQDVMVARCRELSDAVRSYARNLT